MSSPTTAAPTMILNDVGDESKPGPGPSETNNNTNIPKPPTQQPQSQPLDAVSSLRAAALSTLKLKRRKPNPTEPSTGAGTGQVPLTVAKRPLAGQPTVQLDYGTEEPSALDASGSSEQVTVASTSSASTLASSDSMRSVDAPPTDGRGDEAMDVEEGEVREEGEISDDEDAVASSSGQPRATTLAGANAPTATTSTKSTSQPPEPLSDPSDPSRKPARPSTNGKDGSTGHRPEEEPRDVPMRSYTPTHSDYIVDEFHARPGLPMTFPQYTLTKSIILDLLGWGVHPEYLVDCGVSRQAVFYVFTELNLKLPENLDVRGLVPYGPPAVGSVHPPLPNAPAPAPASQQPSEDKYGGQRRTSGAGAGAMLPPTMPPSRGDDYHNQQQRRPSISHPLPAKPSASPLLGSLSLSLGHGPLVVSPTSMSSSTLMSASTSSPGAVAAGSGSLFAGQQQQHHQLSQMQTQQGQSQSQSQYRQEDDRERERERERNVSLHDMEAQRRQELLARKAVLATRRGKGPTSTSSTAPTGPAQSGANSNNAAPSSTTTPTIDTHARARAMERRSSSASDMSLVTPVATEAVDDFLKSIGSGVGIPVPAGPSSAGYRPPLPFIPSSSTSTAGVPVPHPPYSPITSFGGSFPGSSFHPPPTSPSHPHPLPGSGAVVSPGKGKAREGIVSGGVALGIPPSPTASASSSTTSPTSSAFTHAPTAMGTAAHPLPQVPLPRRSVSLGDDAMDVDKRVVGGGGGREKEREREVEGIPGFGMYRHNSLPNVTVPAGASGSTSTSSSGSTPPITSTSTPVNGGPAGRTTAAVPVPVRRGTKRERPVAADFDDFEPSPSVSGLGRTGSFGSIAGQASGNTYASGSSTPSSTMNANGFVGIGGIGHHPPPPYMRRKLHATTFANITVSRRCVIDLSDSEDGDGDGEGDGEDGHHHHHRHRDNHEQHLQHLQNRQDLRYSPSAQTPTPGPTNTNGSGAAYISSSLSSSVMGSRTSTPPVPSGGGGGGGVLSPAALMEKEHQIRKMKEAIAAREKTRMMKMTMVKENGKTPPPPSTSSTHPTSATSQNQHQDSLETTAKVKQEEDDTALLNNHNPNTSETATARSTEEAAAPAPAPAAGVQPSGEPGGGVGVADTNPNPSSRLNLVSDVEMGNVEPEMGEGGDVVHGVIMHVDGAGGVEMHDDRGEDANKSSPTTPTTDDVGMNGFEHGSTGEKVLTREAGHEQVVLNSSHTAQEHLASSSSALTMQEMDRNGYDNSRAEDDAQKYTRYDSPFASYPLLRVRSRVTVESSTSNSTQQQQQFEPSISDLLNLSSTSTSNTTSSSATSSVNSALSPATIDLMPLRARALSGRQDVISKRLCQYEVPGGGQCRDASCEELHVWELEPSDQDTAQFLAGAWPFSEAEIIGALQQARKTQGNKGPSSLETRVAEAYGRLIGQRQEVKSA